MSTNVFQMLAQIGYVSYWIDTVDDRRCHHIISYVRRGSRLAFHPWVRVWLAPWHQPIVTHNCAHDKCHQLELTGGRGGGVGIGLEAKQWTKGKRSSLANQWKRQGLKKDARNQLMRLVRTATTWTNVRCSCSKNSVDRRNVLDDERYGAKPSNLNEPGSAWIECHCGQRSWKICAQNILSRIDTWQGKQGQTCCSWNPIIKGHHRYNQGETGSYKTNDIVESHCYSSRKKMQGGAIMAT